AHYPIHDERITYFDLLVSSKTQVLHPYLPLEWDLVGTAGAADSMYFAVPMKQTTEVIYSDGRDATPDYVFSLMRNRVMGPFNPSFFISYTAETDNPTTPHWDGMTPAVKQPGYTGWQTVVKHNDKNYVPEVNYYMTVKPTADTVATGADYYLTGEVYAAPSFELPENIPVTYVITEAVPNHHFNYVSSDYSNGIEVHVSNVYSSALIDAKIYASQNMYAPDASTASWVSETEDLMAVLSIPGDSLKTDLPVYITVESTSHGMFEVIAGRTGTLATELLDGSPLEIDVEDGVSQEFIMHPRRSYFGTYASRVAVEIAFHTHDVPEGGMVYCEMDIAPLTGDHTQYHTVIYMDGVDT
ncbi:hypothetical protein KIPB_012918, partial [Kipferlia bialata]